MSDGRLVSLDVRGHFVRASARGARFWHVRNHQRDGGTRTFCGARVALDIEVKESVKEACACNTCSERAQDLAWVEMVYE